MSDPPLPPPVGSLVRTFLKMRPKPRNLSRLPASTVGWNRRPALHGPSRALLNTFARHLYRLSRVNGNRWHTSILSSFQMLASRVGPWPGDQQRRSRPFLSQPGERYGRWMLILCPQIRKERRQNINLCSRSDRAVGTCHSVVVSCCLVGLLML